MLYWISCRRRWKRRDGLDRSPAAARYRSGGGPLCNLCGVFNPAKRDRRAFWSIQKASAVAASAILPIAVTVPAHADAITDQFLQEIHGIGVVTAAGGDAALISLGMQICRDVRAGESGPSIIEHYGSSVTNYDAGRFMGISTRLLCPELIPILFASFP
ncbi:MAG: DUF732 domain-containing protein [Akkermansiaceae bacterium]|nr:DUF732 domain-containing protein [Akkermansiaceae bacterium]